MTTTDTRAGVAIDASGQQSARLYTDRATLGYDSRIISETLSVTVPDESFTVIVGANACGKSTLLRGLSGC